MCRSPLCWTAGAVTLLIAFATGPSIQAQARFELLTRDTIAELNGLQIFTIRDGRLATCYTLFVFEPQAPMPTRPSVELSNQSTEDFQKAEVLRRLREAAAKRDRQLSELRARIDPVRDRTKVNEYEAARMQIDGEFERAIAPLLPGSYTYATTQPGMRTGGWDDVAEAMRRAIANPDPATLKTLGDPGGLNAQFESWFQRMIEAPRLAVAGPSPCSPGAADKTETPR